MPGRSTERKVTSNLIEVEAPALKSGADQAHRARTYDVVMPRALRPVPRRALETGPARAIIALPGIATSSRAARDRPLGYQDKRHQSVEDPRQETGRLLTWLPAGDHHADPVTRALFVSV